ncbi:MAG: Histidinol phosphate phosphatase HisJ family [Bacteroidetes bacterium]|nr:Histidinol phosphate phosphatase HisJ family [Bacteroidota bacterium]
MSWYNYHSHSLYCDGKAEPEDFINIAIEKGFHSFGFSSHAPVPFPSKWNLPEGKLNDYIDHIGRIKKIANGRIQVYTGLEIDYIEGIWGRDNHHILNGELDYFIGSIHYIGQFPDGSYFCFDGGNSDNFFHGIGTIYQNNYRRAITAYFHAEMKMLENDKPDIIGHMDKIKMHNGTLHYLNEEEQWYVNLVEELLDLIKQTGCIVEVNTRGLYKHFPPVLYPSPWILKKACQKNIPVIINSDSHHPSEVDAGFKEAAVILKQTGFKTLRVLLNNKWQDVGFDTEGLLI